MSSNSILPEPPDIGLLLLPKPRAILSTFVRFMPWSEKVCKGMIHSVQVSCYAGTRGEQRPTSVLLGDRMLSVTEVFREWIEEDESGRETRMRVFDVLCDDGNFYRLTHKLKQNAWSMTPNPNLLERF